MKKHITFLATVLLLLVFAQKAKAEEVYFLVGQQINGVTGHMSLPSDHKMEQVGNTTVYKLDIDPTNSANDFRFRIGLKDANLQLCPENDDAWIDIHDSFLSSSEYNITATGNVNAWKIRNDAKAYFTIYVDLHEGNARVWVETTKKEETLTYRVGKFIRTYSSHYDMVPLNNDIKIYAAYQYTPPTDINDIYSQEGKLEMRELKYIPKDMGVVLIGSADGSYNSGDTRNFELRKRTDAPEADYKNVWKRASDYVNDDWNNFLEPTVEANESLGNAEVNDAGKITYRYFGLANFYRTKYYEENQTGDDYIGFFRLTENGKSFANKAYLRMPVSSDVEGGRFGFVANNGQFAGAIDETNTTQAKMRMVFDDELGNVTGIKNIERETKNDNAFYTLQGVKVAKPSKGIYIHNGKRIVFK